MTRADSYRLARGPRLAVPWAVLWLATFLFVFGWKPRPGVDLVTAVSITLVFCVGLLGRPRISKPILVMAGVLGVLSVYALFIVLINGALDPQIALRSIRALVNFLGAAALCQLYIDRFGSAFPKHLVWHVFTVLVAHGVLILAMYLQPGLREYVYGIAATRNQVNLTTPFELGYRIPGLTYGLSQTSVLQMSGLILLPAVLRYCVGGVLDAAVALGGGVVLLASVLLTGRSGLMLGMVALPLSSYACLRTARIAQALRGLRRWVVPMFAAAVGVALLAVAAARALPDQFFDYTLTNAAKGLGMVLSGRWGEDVDVANLSKGYFVPDNILVLLFGSSNLGRGELGYIASDAGYVLLIFALGLIGSALMLVPILYSMLHALAVRGAMRPLGVVTAIILASSLALHAKEVALLTRNQWSLQALLTCMCFAIGGSQRARAGSKIPVARPLSPVLPKGRPQFSG